MRPRSSTSSSDANRRLRAFAVAILVIALCETLTALAVDERSPMEEGARYYAAGTFPSFADSLVQWQTRRALQPDRNPDLVFIGDSSCTVGVIPGIIETQVELDVASFCTILHLSPDAHVDLLELFLASHAAPIGVVFYFSDLSLSGSSDWFGRQRVRDRYRRWIGTDDSVIARWPTTRLRARARSWTGGHWYEDVEVDVGVRDYLEKYDGFARPLKQKADDAYPVPVVAIHPDNLVSLKRLAEVTGKAGSKLYLMHAPIPQAAARAEVRRDLAENEGLLRAFAGAFPHVEVAWPLENIGPDALFTDYEHLTLEGAKRNSGRVADWVRRTF